MKKINIQYIFLLSFLVLVAVSFSSCKKMLVEKFIPSRMFTPTSVSVSGGDTSVTISWPASLNAPTKGVTYTVEINTDSSFRAAPALSITVNATSVTITDDTLQDNQRYFARVKANSSNASSSYWMVDTVAFTLIGVQIFHPLQSSDIIDNAVRLTWTPTPDVSEILFTAANGDTTRVAISDSVNMAGQLIVYGLQSGTRYTAQILAKHKSKGKLTFTTLAPVTGANVIDLRSISNDPLVLFDTLSQIPSGSIVLLARGQTYDFPSSYVIDKTVTIQSGLGFLSPAVLSLANNFDASGNIDSIRFSDLAIASAGSNYFMNVSQPTNITTLSVVNCTTQGNYSNSFIRLKEKGDLISNLNINNCIIDSFGVGSKYSLIYANASSAASIANINITNSTFYYFYSLIRQDKVTTSSINISNSTFDNMINQGGYFFQYTTFPTSFNITNCILGNTLDPTNAQGISSSSATVSVYNSYMTSDCVFSANPLTGFTNYSGTASQLFRNPNQGYFTIIDNSFAGKNSSGDPRWRN